MAAPTAKILLDRLDDKFPEWRKTLVDLYDQGASDVEVMRALRLSPSAFEALAKDQLESDFGELVAFGHTLSKAWWMQQGRTNLHTKGFQTSLYTINMKNRFGWSEKQEISQGEAEFSNMSDEDLQKKIETLRKKFSLSRGKD
jgi:hypothetical protein